MRVITSCSTVFRKSDPAAQRITFARAMTGAALVFAPLGVEDDLGSMPVRV
jgi:hypothetical protein